MAENYDERPLRFCDSCGGVDRAPRHVHATTEEFGASDRDLVNKALVQFAGDADAVRAVVDAVSDTAVQIKHIDCCAADGCPSGSCEQQIADAKGKKDEALAKYLTNLGPKAPDNTQED